MTVKKNSTERFNVKVNGQFVDMNKCSYDELKSVLNCISSRKVRGKEGSEYWSEILDDVKAIRDARFGKRKGGKGTKCSYEYTLDEIKTMDLATCTRHLNSINSKICYCKDDVVRTSLEQTRDLYKGRIKFLKLQTSSTELDELQKLFG